jgi:iron complex outermembrane receptor protein
MQFFRWIIFLIFTFLFCGAIFAQSSASISGKVTYGADTILHGAKIQIAQLKISTTTDDDGAFRFNNLPPGKYTLLAHMEGFADATKTVVLVAGANSVVDFQMQITGVTEEVTVTATGSEQSAFDSIQTTSSVDSTLIAQRGAASLGDALENEPGVAKRSATAASSRPVIRGFDGDRVLVSTDGVRDGSLASASGNHAETIDPLSVDRIEVVKGPATLLYGSNAIGGVVNAISGHDEEAHDGTRGYFSAVGGTNNNQTSLSGGVEHGIKNWMFWGSGSGQRTSDYSAGGNFGRVKNTFSRNANGEGGFGYYTKKAFANFNYDYYQSRYGVPVDFREEEPGEVQLKIHKHDFRLNGGFRDMKSAFESAKFSLNYSNYRHRESDFEDGIEAGFTNFRNKVFSYRGTFSQKKYKALAGQVGFDGYVRDFSTTGPETLIRGPVNQKSFSVFGLEEIGFKKISFQFGARVENNRFNPQDLNLRDRNITSFSGAAGMRVSLWDGGAFVANYSHSSRSPALEELYNNGPHDDSQVFEIGNPNLRIETSDGLDFSLRHKSDRLRAEANFYYYDIKRFVFLSPAGETDEDTGLPIYDYTQGDSRFFGTEATLDFMAHKFLNFLGGLDYVNAELKTGTPLPRIPPLRGRLGLDFHYKEMSVKPEWILVADQNRTFTRETRTGGYSVVNVIGSYVIPGKHFANILSVNAFNLTNKLYFNHVSFIKDISPEIGRGIRFNYTIRFF